jgi:hypothetical protein
MVCKVRIVTALKPGVIGKNGRGDGAALDFHGRDDWECDRQRTASKACKIIDKCNFFLMVVIWFHETILPVDNWCYHTKMLTF